MSVFFRRLTALSLALAIAMTLLSAYIRLADSGMDCEPWPTCFTSAFRVDMEPGITISEADPYKGLRATHRLMASVFGIFAIFMLILAWRYRDAIPVRLSPTLVFILTLVLTFVGMRTPDLIHPAVMLTNLTGGMTLSAILLWQRLQLTSTLRPSLFPVVLLFCCLLAIASGAWVSANFAAGSCTALADCFANASLDAINPLRELVITEGILQITAAQPFILVVHYVTAGLLLALVVVQCIYSYRDKSRVPVVPLVLVLVITIFGGLEFLVRGSLAASVHNLLALLLLLAIVQFTHQTGHPHD
jgi:cytochrome c oxidase assembly protein subunit 15